MPLPNRRRAVALCLTLLGCSRVSTPASAGPAQFTGANPFASASPLLYQAPPFDRIHDADYQPALEEGMRQQLVEVARIAADSCACVASDHAATMPPNRLMNSRRFNPRRRRHPARRFANGRSRSSLMMQPAGKVSPLPRCPIKSNQERKRREKKEIASCRQHRT